MGLLQVQTAVLHHPADQARISIVFFAVEFQVAPRRQGAHRPGTLDRGGHVRRQSRTDSLWPSSVGSGSVFSCEAPPIAAEAQE